MLTYYEQIDKRTTMKNQNRSAALGRPAMKLLGGGGGGLQLVFGRPTEAGTDEGYKIAFMNIKLYIRKV